MIHVEKYKALCYIYTFIPKIHTRDKFYNIKLYSTNRLDCNPMERVQP